MLTAFMDDDGVVIPWHDFQQMEVRVCVVCARETRDRKGGREGGSVCVCVCVRVCVL